jgi:hypothetical protein
MIWTPPLHSRRRRHLLVPLKHIDPARGLRRGGRRDHRLRQGLPHGPRGAPGRCRCRGFPRPRHPRHPTTAAAHFHGGLRRGRESRRGAAKSTPFSIYYLCIDSAIPAMLFTNSDTFAFVYPLIRIRRVLLPGRVSRQ